MKFDPTISFGTIIASVSICLTIISSFIANYICIVKHMTKQEQAFESLMKEVRELKQRQDKQEVTVSSIKSVLDHLLGQFQMYIKRLAE